MAARQTNAAVLSRIVRRLRRDGRIDDLAEPLVALAGTSKLVDLVTSDDPLNDTPAYARAACVRTHTVLLTELASRIPASRADVEDPWERIARALDPHSDGTQFSP